MMCCGGHSPGSQPGFGGARETTAFHKRELERGHEKKIIIIIFIYINRETALKRYF
jgi:hypothetical protein